MKFLIDNWMLIAVAFASGGMLLWPAIVSGARSGGLSPGDAVQRMNREKAVVVDVGETDEFKEGHIVGARHIPLSDLEKRLPEVVKNKALPLIFVCKSGARAGRAATAAKNLGYDKAEVLAGGLTAWKEANLPVEKG